MAGSFRTDGDMPYCAPCHVSRFAEKCASCGHGVDGKMVRALGQVFHPEHFVCSVCSAPLAQGRASSGFVLLEGEPACKKHTDKIGGGGRAGGGTTSPMPMGGGHRDRSAASAGAATAAATAAPSTKVGCKQAVAGHWHPA